jgi:hypothetical protein
VFNRSFLPTGKKKTASQSLLVCCKSSNTGLDFLSNRSKQPLLPVF